MPANELAEQYLHTFASNGAFPDGLAFHEALRQARLDYTPESLERIDALLRRIRKELHPSFADFIDKNAHQNFLYLLCFYVGAVVYRYTREDFAWYSYEELKQVAPLEFMADYPEAFATSMVCMLKDSGTFLPLSSIQDVLFGDDSERSVLASADKFMGRLPDAGPIERPASAVALRDDKITRGLRAAGNCAGWAAGYAIWMLCEGGALDKTLQHQLADGKRLGVVLVDSSLEEAFERLGKNDDGAAVSVLSYQGVVGLADGRSDAVVLEVRNFSLPEIVLTIAIPFRPAGAKAGFAVFAPRVLRPANLGAVAREVIATGFFEGIDEYKPAGLLEKYLETRA